MKIIYMFLVLFMFNSTLAETKKNDFPTLARSEFVFACMSSNANNRQNVLVPSTKYLKE